MFFVIEDYIYHFRYLAHFIGDLINIIDWYSLRKFVCIQMVFLYKTFINEDFYNIRVN